MDLLPYALSCLELGLSVMPVDMELKRPLVRWTEYMSRLMTPQEARRLHWPGLGLITGRGSGYVVVDCDDRPAADYWWQWRPRTPMVAKTRRGYHFYYRWAKEIRSDSGISLGTDLKYDVRGDGGYVVLPPTKNYRFLWGMCDPEALPEFNPAWRPTKDIPPAGYNRQPRRATGDVEFSQFGEWLIARALREAPDGRNRAGFRMALQLRDAGYSIELAQRVIVQYQQQVQGVRPGPYTADEALRSVESAYRRPPRSRHHALRQTLQPDL
jgi:hypothetical protein